MNANPGVKRVLIMVEGSKRLATVFTDTMQLIVPKHLADGTFSELHYQASGLRTELGVEIWVPVDAASYTTQ